MAGERLVQYAIILVSGLGTLAALAWLVLLDHGPRWFLLAALGFVALLPGVIAYQFLRADLQAARGRAEQEWVAAGQRLAEVPLVDENGQPRLRWTRFLFWEWATPIVQRKRVWIEEPVPEPNWQPQPPRTTFVQGGPPPAPPLITLTAGQRARLLLLWCYDRAGKGLGYGQQDVQRPWTRRLYDEAMDILKHLGLVTGRERQGDPAELAIIPQSGQTWTDAQRIACIVFDDRVTDD